MTNEILLLFNLSRKIEIVQFASRTRQQFVRLLALVKWAASADRVDKCQVSWVKSDIHLLRTSAASYVCIFTFNTMCFKPSKFIQNSGTLYGHSFILNVIYKLCRAWKRRRLMSGTSWISHQANDFHSRPLAQ